MKVWFKAKLEKDDPKRLCSKCNTDVTAPDLCFVEFEILSGSMPNPQELHPEPTGKILCARCGEDLV